MAESRRPSKKGNSHEAKEQDIKINRQNLAEALEQDDFQTIVKSTLALWDFCRSFIEEQISQAREIDVKKLKELALLVQMISTILVVEEESRPFSDPFDSYQNIDAALRAATQARRERESS